MYYKTLTRQIFKARSEFAELYLDSLGEQIEDYSMIDISFRENAIRFFYSSITISEIRGCKI